MIPVGTKVRVRQDTIDPLYAGAIGVIETKERNLGFQCSVKLTSWPAPLLFMYSELEVYDPISDEMLDKAIEAYGPLRNGQSPGDHRTDMKAALEAAFEEK